MSIVSFAQKKNAYKASIDSLLATTNPRPFNGVVLIRQKGKTTYQRAYGFANLHTKKPLTMNDQFEIMSNSKQVTAVLILLEAEQGRIILQAPIKRYLPYLTQPWADTVTVHQLLNHTHGIVDINKPLEFAPGSDFKYGNLSNILLGKIIEFASKKPYKEMANALFKKLGMNNTFCYTSGNNQRLVSGHNNKNNVFEVVDSSFVNEENLPADGVVSTAGDLAIWDANLHKGKILRPESYQQMTTSSVMTAHTAFGKEKAAYGYGIRIVDSEGVKYLGHTGLGDGFTSLNLYFPKSDVSMIVLENQMNENFELNYYIEIEIKKILLQSDLLK